MSTTKLAPFFAVVLLSASASASDETATPRTPHPTRPTPVDVMNQPTVNVGSMPAVTVAGTPNVAVAGTVGITGTPSVRMAVPQNPVYSPFLHLNPAGSIHTTFAVAGNLAITAITVANQDTENGVSLWLYRSQNDASCTVEAEQGMGLPAFTVKLRPSETLHLPYPTPLLVSPGCFTVRFFVWAPTSSVDVFAQARPSYTPGRQISSICARWPWARASRASRVTRGARRASASATYTAS